MNVSAQNALSCEWLCEAQALIEQGNYSVLEAHLPAAVPQGLFSDATLDSARAQRLVATVIYLATLGEANLPKPNDRSMWLAVYQSLKKGAATPELEALTDSTPIKRVVAAVVAGANASLHLAHCARVPEGWLSAIQLTFDISRFDLLYAIVDYLRGRKMAAVDWLRIADGLYRRQQMRGQPTFDADFARSLSLVAGQLPQNRVCEPPRSLLALQAMEVFQGCGEFRSALEAARMVTVPVDRTRARVLAAMAHSHLGKYEMAIDALDAWLAEKTSDRSLPGTIQLMRQRHQETLARKALRSAFDDRGSAVLVDFVRVLRGSSIKCFAISGTLLGIVREGRLLPHDDDLDFGVHGWEAQYELAELLSKSADFVTRTNDLKKEKTLQQKVFHAKTGIQVDVFTFFTRGNGFGHFIESDFGYALERQYPVFETTSRRVYGVDVCVPDPAERFLEHNYGNDWRTPDPVSGGIVAIPNTVDEGGLIHQLAFRHYLWMCIRDGNQKKMEKALLFMSRLAQSPRKLDGGLESKLMRLARVELD